MAEQKRKRGRKPFAPTEEQRKELPRLAGIGLNYDQLAAWLEISPSAFDDLLIREPSLREAISKGRAAALGKVAAALYSQASTGKNMTATIFYLKTRGRWAEARDPGPENPEEENNEFKLSYKD